jgi:hypothetical protein
MGTIALDGYPGGYVGIVPAFRAHARGVIAIRDKWYGIVKTEIVNRDNIDK